MEIKNIIPFVISFFALYYICLLKKSYFINAFDLRLHDVLFSDHSVGEAEVTTEILWSEFFICSRFGRSSFPPHFKAKYVTPCLKGFCSSQVFCLRVWRFFQIQHMMHVQARAVSITTGCPACSPLISCCNTGITFFPTWLSLLRSGIPFIKAHVTLCEGRFNCGPSKPLQRMSELTNDCNVI